MELISWIPEQKWGLSILILSPLTAKQQCGAASPSGVGAGRNWASTAGTRRNHLSTCIALPTAQVRRSLLQPDWGMGFAARRLALS